MYTLVSALGKAINSGGRWSNIDIGDMLMTNIFKQYSRVYVELSNPYLAQHVSLNLQDIRKTAGGLGITFNEFLTQNGNATLPTSNTLYTLKTKYARYCDAHRAGYQITPVNPLTSPDAELPLGDKTWLHLQRPDTDFNLFARHCMVTVNGYFHRVEANSDGAWVVDGVQSKLLSGMAEVGVVSFMDLGEIQHIALTPEMVYRQNDRQSLRHTAYIDVGQDLTGKTVMLVLGGYLHVLDQKAFHLVSNRMIGVDLQNLPLLERYHESRSYIDYSSLGLDRYDGNETVVSVDEFMSDETLLRYLTLPQSFLVILDNSEVFVERGAVRRTPFPGMLIAYERPWYPLVSGLGKLSEYWSTYEDGQWSLTMNDNAVHHRLYRITNSNNLMNASDSRNPTDRAELGECYFLKIGTDI